MSNTTLDQLRHLLQRAGSRCSPRKTASRSGSSGTDWLPGPELAPGDVSEWIARDDGSGALQLALAAAQKAVSTPARWLVVDFIGDLFPGGWEEAGINLSRTVFVRNVDTAAALWAVEQGLRSRGVDVVCCRIDRLTSVMGRRLKIAAETGNSLCLLLRGTEALRETSSADLRVLVSPVPSENWFVRRMEMEVLKIRNGFPGMVAQLELDDETGAVRMVSELGDSAAVCRAAGA
ncbi:ImuA family protein [Planctomicrobium sp. SH668]|uniref:ImuA family protein n=1 Tax=Planctomicrobium sp. SH668 TaxID=3448126 RepID=UPI003F5C8009